MVVRAEGAEAVVGEETFLGLSCVRKTRPVKRYRHPALDRRLRGERLRTEVRLLREARRVGVRTPVVLDVDLEASSLMLEKLEGPTLAAVLTEAGGTEANRGTACEQWGHALGQLHRAGISHGDLTASNVLSCEGNVALLDLSLGARAASLEALGVDLHLVREDLNTLCSDAEPLFARFLAGYRAAFPQGHAEVEERAQEIQGRVRYS